MSQDVFSFNGYKRKRQRACFTQPIYDGRLCLAAELHPCKCRLRDAGDSFMVMEFFVADNHLASTPELAPKNVFSA